MLIVEKLLKKWLNNITIFVRNLGFFHVNFFSIIIKLTWRKKSSVTKQGSHCFHYENYAQKTQKQFHLLFMHNDNKSNSGQIRQVITVGGSGNTQYFFLC